MTKTEFYLVFNAAILQILEFSNSTKTTINILGGEQWFSPYAIKNRKCGDRLKLNSYKIQT